MRAKVFAEKVNDVNHFITDHLRDLGLLEKDEDLDPRIATVFVQMYLFARVELIAAGNASEEEARRLAVHVIVDSMILAELDELADGLATKQERLALMKASYGETQHHLMTGVEHQIKYAEERTVELRELLAEQAKKEG